MDTISSWLLVSTTEQTLMAGWLAAQYSMEGLLAFHFGTGHQVGTSGPPNAMCWLEGKQRLGRIKAAGGFDWHAE